MYDERVMKMGKQTMRGSCKKGTPFRAPKVGTMSDLIPGIVFKLYPTIISKNVSDYLRGDLSGVEESEEREEVGWRRPFPASGNAHALPFLHSSHGSSYEVKRRHSRACLGGSKQRKREEHDKWEEKGHAMRRHSIQGEQLVPRNSPSLSASKENSSDSEIDVTSLSMQSEDSPAAGDKKLKRKMSGVKKNNIRRPSHIVCNKLLMTTSRRISATSMVDGRLCASCSASITPYWRDGWSDQLMLCNACGLRFQKFMKRCNSCNYIPRKEDNELADCPHCHDVWV